MRRRARARTQEGARTRIAASPRPRSGFMSRDYVSCLPAGREWPCAVCRSALGMGLRSLRRRSDAPSTADDALHDGGNLVRLGDMDRVIGDALPAVQTSATVASISVAVRVTSAPAEARLRTRRRRSRARARIQLARRVDADQVRHGVPPLASGRGFGLPRRDRFSGFCRRWRGRLAEGSRRSHGCRAKPTRRGCCDRCSRTNSRRAVPRARMLHRLDQDADEQQRHNKDNDEARTHPQPPATHPSLSGAIRPPRGRPRTPPM